MRRSGSQRQQRKEFVLEEDPEFQLTRPRPPPPRNSALLKHSEPMATAGAVAATTTARPAELSQRPQAAARRRTVLHNKDIFTDSEMELTSMQPLARPRPSRESTTSSTSSPSDRDDDDVDYSDTARLTQPNRRKDSLPPAFQNSTSRDHPGSTPGADLESQTPGRVPAINITNPSRSLAALGTVLQRTSSRVVNLSNRETGPSSDHPPPVPPLPPGLARQGTKKRHKSMMEPRKDQDVEETTAVASEEKKPDVLPQSPPPFVLRKDPVLVGRSLWIFGPENPFRRWLHRILTNRWTESFILLLIFLNAIVLTAQAWDGNQHREQGWGNDWTDYVLLGIFIIYTLEITGRIIVEGLMLDSTPLPAASAVDPTRRSKTAFLRHSWNRIDLLAVVSYWIDLVLTFAGEEYTPPATPIRIQGFGCLQAVAPSQRDGWQRSYLAEPKKVRAAAHQRWRIRGLLFCIVRVSISFSLGISIMRECN